MTPPEVQFDLSVVAAILVHNEGGGRVFLPPGVVPEAQAFIRDAFARSAQYAAYLRRRGEPAPPLELRVSRRRDSKQAPDGRPDGCAYCSR